MLAAGRLRFSVGFSLTSSDFPSHPLSTSRMQEKIDAFVQESKGREAQVAKMLEAKDLEKQLAEAKLQQVKLKPCTHTPCVCVCVSLSLSGVRVCFDCSMSV